MKTVFFSVVFLFSFIFVSFSQDTIRIKGLVNDSTIFTLDTSEVTKSFIILNDKDEILEIKAPVYIFQELNLIPEGYKKYIKINPEKKVGAILIKKETSVKNTMTHYDNVLLYKIIFL